MPKTITILVVDDERDSADALAMVLSAAGYATEKAYDAAAALAIAGQHHPRLAFLDAAMPKVDGFALARQLRQLPGMANAVLVCLTGYGGPKYEQDARDAGCDYFMLKPSSPEEVLNIARQVAGQSPTNAGKPGVPNGL